MKRPVPARVGWRSAWLGGLSVVLLLGASAIVSVFTHAHAAQDLVAPPHSFDWQNPLVDGVSMTDVASAEPSLAFSPLVPSGLSSDPVVYMSNPTNFPASAREIALSYADPKLGTFVILERPVDITQSELESLVSHNSDGGGVSFSLITLPNGTVALVEGGPNASSVEWLNADSTIVVMGPTATFSIASAEAVARLVTASQ